MNYTGPDTHGVQTMVKTDAPLADEEGVVIATAVYHRLQADRLFLQRLRDAGVDNWDGYHLGYGPEDDNDE